MKNYIPRTIEKQIKSAGRDFPVVVLTGPRQTGKSTLLKKLFSKYTYITLDDPLTRNLAQEDPKLFLSRHQHVIIDEIQYLPELLPYIKIMVDQDRSKNGRYILTGSQFFPLMHGISESLAGRAALFELLGFSHQEAPWIDYDIPKFCFAALFDGFYPEVIVHGANRNRFYSSYLQTYLERDIRQITSVHDLKVFQNYLELLAARVGSLLNLNEVSKECGITFTTAKRWLSLLETSRIVYLLRPYTKNISKRVIKSAKLYFSDTGLLAAILRYPTPETVQSGPLSGSLFENFIVVELLKYKFNHNKLFELFFYRDSNHNEIDIIIDQGSSLLCLEIKNTSTPQKEHLTTLARLQPLIKNSKAYLMSFASEAQVYSKTVTSIPWMQLFQKKYLL
ncbi:ATP-binding protein [bacterium]|nr:ATP-binding protein [bacterium]